MANFSPFIETTSNVTNFINKMAKEKNIRWQEIDFDLIKTQTLIQSEQYNDWTIIEDPIEKIFDDNAIKSSKLLIKQEYQIRIRPFAEDVLQNVKMEVTFNKARTKVVATFKAGSVFPCKDNLAKLLKREINRKKLRLGFLIGHFEGRLNAILIKLSKELQCDSPLDKDVRITIAASPSAQDPVDEVAIVHYESNNKGKSGMVAGVDPDALLFEYVKPIVGENGRSCSGLLIITPKPKTIPLKYRADEDTIYAQEDEKSVKYYSKVAGYVKKIGYVISISNKINMTSATFRNNQSIETQANQDISVNIRQTNQSDDAIGSGIVMDVKELNVDGTVGANAKVKATQLKIGEQTHRNSQLEAVENATVHLHRGNLKAKTARIEILENGTIQADDVYVKKMLGGEIIGHRVVVDELVSNATITASESIEIGYISGDHNSLIINPDKIEAYHEKVSALKAQIKENTNALKDLLKEYSQKLSEHKALLPRIQVFQERCLLAKKSAETPNKTDLLRVKLYKQESEKLKNEAEVLKMKESEITSVNNELEKLYEAELHATITNKGDYNGHTKVTFVDLKTSQEYSMSPEGVYDKLFFIKNGDEKKISW
mgnify:CR=1 FL=1